jgi:hypothetical protein
MHPPAQQTPASTREALAWAEVAGLVRINADGSWSATDLAKAALGRSAPGCDQAAGGGAGGGGRAKISF